MKTLKTIVAIALGVVFILSGISHFTSPDLSSGLIPDFLPKTVVHIGVGIIEICLGLGAILPATRKKALWGIFILMIGFLPIHIIDLFRAGPVIGSKMVAFIRLLFQFLLIYLPWFAMRTK